VTSIQLLLVGLFLAALLVAGVLAWRGPLARRKAARADARIRAEEETRRIYDLLRRAHDALFGRPEYLAASMVSAWRAEHEGALREAADGAFVSLLAAPQQAEARRWCADLSNLPRSVADYNVRFVAARTAEEQAAFDTVEANPLTSRQREAIVTDEDATLVNAGAGTGKTSTIVGKVDYLVRRGLARPEEILVLAFGKKAQQELGERLTRLRGHRGVRVSTFHALGLAILGEAEGRRPSLSPLAEDEHALDRFIRTRVADLLTDPGSRALLRAFFSSLLDEEPADRRDQSPEEAILRERERGLRALDGTFMKSREEVRIANWLTLSGIAWEYERNYPVDTRTAERRQYRPDFYLPEHDVYLEHFGVDREGNTRPGIDPDRYRRGMAWKRAFHAEHGTCLVETYSYLAREGTLIAELEARLAARGVLPRPLSDDAIRSLVAEANRGCSDFVRLVAQFLKLARGNGRAPEELTRRARTPRDRVFLQLFLPIRAAYEAALTRDGAIDFDDMIVRAAEHVRSGRYPCAFKYLIVDEFQDISEHRLGLLLALRARVPHARLFVVGDDWQAIYRFAGADIALITDLARHAGPTARVDLDTTFRYRQELLDCSAQFVMRNPRQLRKALRSAHGPTGRRPIRVAFQEGAGQVGLREALAAASDDIRADAGGQGAEVLFLGRYHFNRPDCLDEIAAALGQDGLTAGFLTAHAAKGREADYVVVLGLEAGEYGFPSQVSDDPVLGMVLAEPEPHPHAEERRLFYVALTRARRRVYLVAPRDKSSAFIRQDLLGEDLRAFVDTIGGEASGRHRCPLCGGETIRRTEGRYGTFWACAHYPACEGKLAACPACAEGGLVLVGGSGQTPPRYSCTSCPHEVPICPRCGRGYLRRVSGRNGPFLGCSRYDGGQGCRYTRNLPAETGAGAANRPEWR
jgi:DNA helicase IV